jgi:hypothetical protein
MGDDSAHDGTGSVCSIPKAQTDQEDRECTANWLYQIIHHNPHEIPSGHVQDDKHEGSDDVGCPKGVSPLQIAKNCPSHEELL